MLPLSTFTAIFFERRPGFVNQTNDKATRNHSVKKTELDLPQQSHQDQLASVTVLGAHLWEPRHQCAVRRSLAIIVILAGLVLGASAQSDSSPRTVLKPDTPPVSSSDAPRAGNAAADNRFSTSLDHDADLQFQRFIHYHPDYGFVRKPQEPKNPVSRMFYTIFKPEPIHIGQHAVFSCTIVTAIKRKNPLCLLNPMVIDCSW
jgi:hypothetical protein